MTICFDCIDCEDIFAIKLQLSNLVDSISIPILAVMFKFFEWKDFLAVQGITLKKEDYLSETTICVNQYSSLDYETVLAVMTFFLFVWNNLWESHFDLQKGVNL